MRYRTAYTRHSIELLKAIGFAMPWIRRARLRRGRYKTQDATVNWQTYCETPWETLRRGLALNDAAPHGRSLLELGPGDFIGVGIHWLAAGGDSYVAIDRFPSPVFSTEAHQAYRMILPDEAQLRSVLARIEYWPVGIDKLIASGRRSFDVIFSHRVMQHVGDLAAAFRHMRTLMTERTVCLHYWDFGSCGVSHGYPHEFLDIGARLYRIVYQSRGYPNRIPLSQVKQIAADAGLRTKMLETVRYCESDLADSRIRLRRSDLSADDLATKEALLQFSLTPRRSGS